MVSRKLSLQGKLNYNNTQSQRKNMIQQEKFRILTEISKEDFDRLYEMYGSNIGAINFAKYFLDIEPRTCELLQKGKIKQTKILGREYVSQQEINRISKEVSKFLSENKIKKVNYELLMFLYEKYGGILDIKTFAEEILGVRGDRVYKITLQNGKSCTLFSSVIIERDEIKRRQDELVKKENLCIGKKITLEDLMRLHSQYGNGLSESDFATKILQINAGQYDRLKRGTYNEMPVFERYYISPEEIILLRSFVIEQEELKVEETISRKRFEELYQTYGGALTENMFAEEILGMSYGCEILRAKKELSEEEKEKITSYVLTDIEIPREFIEEMQALIMKEKSIKAHESLTIEEIRALHQEFCPFLPERTFATLLLDIPYDNYIGVRNQNNTTEIFVSFPVQEFDFASIRERIIAEKKLHYGDNINYKTLQRWHKEYAPESEEREFAEKVLDITYYALKGIKRSCQKDDKESVKDAGTNILKRQPLPIEKDIFKMRYKIVEEYSIHARDFITYSTFQEIYAKYGGILPDYMFAEQVLTISREQLRNMRKNPEKESVVFGQVTVSEREIENLRGIVFYDQSVVSGGWIAPTQFYKLYNRFPHLLTPIQFSEKILGISKKRYLDMMRSLVFDKKELDGYLAQGMGEKEISEILQLPRPVVRKKLKALDYGKRKIKKAIGKVESNGCENSNTKNGTTEQKGVKTTVELHKSERIKKGKVLRKSVSKIIDNWEFGEDENSKLRDYINNCYERYENEEFETEELDDLEDCLYALQVGEDDIVMYSQICMSFGKYKKATNFIVNSIDNPNLEEDEIQRLKQCLPLIQHAIKKEKAINMLFAGEKDLKKIAERTGLPEGDVIILHRKWNEGKIQFAREDFE